MTPLMLADPRCAQCAGRGFYFPGGAGAFAIRACACVRVIDAEDEFRSTEYIASSGTDDTKNDARAPIDGLAHPDGHPDGVPFNGNTCEDRRP